MNLPTATKKLIYFSFPIIIGQLGQMLIAAGDVYVASMHSTESVASIGVAGGVLNPIFLFGIGLMMGISPAMAISRGEGSDTKNNLFSIIGYSLLYGLLLSFIMIIINKFVPYFGFDEKLVKPIQDYIDIVLWSIPFALLFQGIKEYLQAYDKVMLPNILSMVGVVLNLGINYVLCFGYRDFDGLGTIGLAYASFLIRFILAVVILAMVFKKIDFSQFSFSFITKTFKFSVPIAFMFFLEVLAFCTVTILSGKLGIVEAAANNIIMTIASIAFMIPLSMSSAIATKVGHALGAKNYIELRIYTRASIYMVGTFVLLSASFFYLFPVQIMAVVSKDPAVIKLGVSLLFIVMIFQFFDGFQVLLTGILRGLKSTRVSSILVFVGYWVIGIPTGVLLGFNTPLGAKGLWIGLAISLGIVAFALTIYTSTIFKKLELIHEDI